MKTKLEALYIEPLALKKIQYWADAAEGEVSGLGILEKEEGRFVVKDAFILEQECSGADTELDPEAISKLMTDIIKEGKDPGKLKFWWHSHVNMQVFWSGTDDECAETLSTEFAFSLVVNKSKDRKVRFDQYGPIRLTIDNLRLIEMSPEDEDLKKTCAQDVKDKVKSKSYNYDYRRNGHGYFNGEYGGLADEDEGWYRRSYIRGADDKKKSNKGWGKRVKLGESEIEDINDLKNCIFQKGFAMETIKEFVRDSFKRYAKEKLEKSASCSDGAGTYMDHSPICKGCKIGELCSKLTARFGDEKPDDPSEAGTGDIEVTVDRTGECD